MNLSVYKMKKECFERNSTISALAYIFICGLATGIWLAVSIPL